MVPYLALCGCAAHGQKPKTRLAHDPKRPVHLLPSLFGFAACSRFCYGQYSHMHIANVATTRNELSRLLRRVKRGETVVITERNRPIARLLPIAPAENPGEADLEALVAAGVLLPPAGARLDVAAFLTAPRASLPPEASLTAAVRVEREEGR